jgi:hypothetical protein
MAFDSAADLLFNIGANSDDAEANIARFRALLGTDLEALKGQFSDWSEEVFGELNTVKGALLGITAGVAALAVGVAAFAVEGAHKFEEYALAVGNAATKTGLSVEYMSQLKYAANAMSVDFDSLTKGVTLLERSLSRANTGSEQQAAAFHRLGFTTKELQGASQNLEGFLGQVMDRFQGLKDGSDKTRMAMDLFGRSGAGLLRFLNLGSKGVAELISHMSAAEKITLENVKAARMYEGAMKAAKIAQEAMDLEIGKVTLPYMMSMRAIFAGFFETLRKDIESFKSGKGPLNFFHEWDAAIWEVKENLKKMVAGGEVKDKLEDIVPEALPAKVKAATEDFHALTTELDGMREKLAAMEGPEAKLGAELEVMRNRAQNAAAELIKLHGEGKLAPGVWEREAQSLVALRAAIGQYGEAAAKVLGEKDLEELQKYIDGLDAAKAAIDEKIVAAGRELQEKIDAQTTHTFERQVAVWNAEIEKLREKLAAEGALTSANKKLLESLETAGLDKIYAEREAAYQRELTAARDHAGKMLEADMTPEGKLAAQLQIQLDKFSEEKAKELALTASTAAKGEEIERQYAAIRLQLMAQYQSRVQELTNSQGFQSMFGDKFGALIKNNEELSKQWSQSVNQSTMLVRVAVESMGEQAKEAFDKMSEGMGGAIAHALVYGGSIGKAMRQAAAATLESMAEQDIVMAIQSMAWGFYDLAVGNYEGAASAFEAAALFGSVGVGEAMLGRVAAGRQSSGAGGGGGYSNAGGGGGMGGPGNSSGGGGGGMGGAGGQGVTVNVWGHVFGMSGVEELASALNDAVQNRDVRLVASQTRQGPLATH